MAANIEAFPVQRMRFTLVRAAVPSQVALVGVRFRLVPTSVLSGLRPLKVRFSLPRTSVLAGPAGFVKGLAVANGLVQAGCRDLVRAADIAPGVIGAAAFCGVRARRTAGAFTVNDSTQTPVDLTNEDFDSDAFHDNATNPARLTVPAGKAGKYAILGRVEWTNPGIVTGKYEVRLRVNGATTIAYDKFTPVPSGDRPMQLSTTYALAVGDYVTIEAYQDTGSSQTINASAAYSPVLEMYLVGT